MTTPSVTLRSVSNEDTGIDISVPRFKEEEAPLGGISVLYEIFVVTKLEIFKTRLHKSGDTVHFTIFKAYREIEDLYNKLNKKYPKAGLPPVPKASSKYTDDERVEALDLFFKAIARNVEICHSSIFTHFIGINSHRLPSFSLPKTESTDNCDKTTHVQSEESDNSKPETATDAEVFPKMKVNVVEKAPPSPQPVKNVDLFEEVKLTKETTMNTNSKGKSSHGLFDDLEEDDLLFSSVSAEKAPLPKQEEKPKESKDKIEVKKPEAPKRKEKVTPAPDVDDSQIIIKDRKPGDVSLFEDQDLGDYITKDEEALFLVTSPSTTEGKKNTMLFFEREDSPEDVDEGGQNENLDDLLDLAPLPNSPFSSKKLVKEEPERNTEKEQEIPEPPPKPVPLPRKKSLGKVEVEPKPEVRTSKPEVMPRKVFLNKTSVSTEEPKQKPEPPVRPTVPAKPAAVQAKPAPPPKPKPPPKKPKPNAQTSQNNSKELDTANANEPVQTENTNSVSEDLKELDILKYIEQEEKSLDAQLNLFD